MTAAGSERAQSEVRGGLRFVLTTLAWLGLLSAAYYYPYSADGLVARALQRYLELIATLAAGCIRLIQSDATAHGTWIYGAFPLEIVKSCSSLDAQALYLAAVLAFPAPWRNKGAALLAGLTLLNVLNIVRIASLYFVGQFAAAQFEWVHEEVFPLLLVGFAVLTFVLWAQRETRGTRALA